MFLSEVYSLAWWAQRWWTRSAHACRVAVPPTLCAPHCSGPSSTARSSRCDQVTTSNYTYTYVWYGDKKNRNSVLSFSALSNDWLPFCQSIYGRVTPPMRRWNNATTLEIVKRTVNCRGFYIRITANLVHPSSRSLVSNVTRWPLFCIMLSLKRLYPL